MSDELKPPRDVIAENAERQCTPQSYGPITWALSSVMREFARVEGLGDAAHDALVDAVSRVMATYDKYAKESCPTPEQSGEASVSCLLKQEGAAPSSDSVPTGDIDELVPPAAVRADEVNAEIINAGLNGVKSNLSTAADADPHGNSRIVGAEVHDSPSEVSIQGCPEAWRWSAA